MRDAVTNFDTKYFSCHLFSPVSDISQSSELLPIFTVLTEFLSYLNQTIIVSHSHNTVARYHEISESPHRAEMKIPSAR